MKAKQKAELVREILENNFVPIAPAPPFVESPAQAVDMSMKTLSNMETTVNREEEADKKEEVSESSTISLPQTKTDQESDDTVEGKINSSCSENNLQPPIVVPPLIKATEGFLKPKVERQRSTVGRKDKSFFESQSSSSVPAQQTATQRRRSSLDDNFGASKEKVHSVTATSSSKNRPEFQSNLTAPALFPAKYKEEISSPKQSNQTGRSANNQEHSYWRQ